MRVLTSEISESRDLHTDERTLVRWLLDHAPRDASVYLSQVDQIRVLFSMRVRLRQSELRHRRRRLAPEGSD